MKTSKYILSKTQYAIVATILALSTLSLGCDEITGTTPPPTAPTPTPTLEGIWVAVDQDGNQDSNNVLVLLGSSGFHQVDPAAGNADKLYKEFLYQKISSSILRITTIRHQVNGESQTLEGQEDVLYSLDNQSLSIFNQRFVRE